MKKRIFIIITASVILLAGICKPSAESEYKNSTENIYRLHIIANSDSVKDQAVKLSVRDAVLNEEKRLFNEYGSAKNAKEAKKILMDNADVIYNAARQVLSDNGFDYNIKISTGTYSFPTREYNGIVFPADDYDALKIVLGNGEGKNWWCVMFPPLCIINDDAGQIENKETETGNNNGFKSIFVCIFKRIKNVFN